MNEIGNVSAKLWEGVLGELGFTARGASGIYSHPEIPVFRTAPDSTPLPDSVVFSVEAGWGILRAEWRPQPEDHLRGQLGRPGLWKSCGDATSAEAQPICELPPALLAVADPRGQGEEGAWLMRDTLAWGLATAAGEPLAGWELPDANLVAACLPPEYLTVQVGPVLRQISVENEPGLLALRCGLLPHLPDDLSPQRRGWLAELLRDGHNRWRLVRIGITPDDTVVAEVDLSGAPPDALEPLLKTGLEALRYAVEGLVRATDFLADSSVTCRAVEVHSPRG